MLKTVKLKTPTKILFQALTKPKTPMCGQLHLRQRLLVALPVDNAFVSKKMVSLIAILVQMIFTGKKKVPPEVLNTMVHMKPMTT